MEKEPKDTTKLERLLGIVASVFSNEGYKQAHAGEGGLRARAVLLANPSTKNLNLLLDDHQDSNKHN